MKQMTQQECRNVQMDILDEIVRVCKENEIQCYLAFGSLLGAVRHKGYIPWDDDIDVCIVREDYEKFIKIMKSGKSGAQDYYTLIDNTTEGYFYPIAKMIDNRTFVNMERHTMKHGMWVDIFPLDGVTASPFMSKIHMTLCAFMRVIALAMDANFTHSKFGFTYLYKRFFKTLSAIVGQKRICRIHEKIFKYYKVADCKYIANLFTNNGTRSMMDKERLLKVAEYSFENRLYESYADYDYYLTRMYGDYMIIPPESKRITHAYDAWWV